MKIIVAVLTASCLLAGLVDCNGAEPSGDKSYSGKMPRHVSRDTRNDRYTAERSGYFEHWAAKLPFGSARWWEQMVSEDRVRR